ncbi:RHS repeat-associated core domain-containing protein [Clostridium gasigenes]|uniref:RHS repeat-associated core domain-containing protein n=1 Tax=Clostridium gasigenes TaxID=94869 RepID=UPI003399460D
MKDNNENSLAVYDYYKSDNVKTLTVGNGLKIDYNYAYDLNGNRLKEASYDGRKENFTYDKQENTIKEEANDGNNNFEYNTLNQQVKAITKDGKTLVSRYNTEGLRAEIEENEKLTKFIFHKENILVETDGDLNSELESRYFYSQDEQGSTVYITDKEQSIKNEYSYDAFGNVLDSREDVHNRITYTGQPFDGITQQYYLRARFYNPVIGRFTQEDVYRGDGLNLYAYCGNNPVVYYDPSGYALCSPNKERIYNEYKDLRNQGLTPQQAYDRMKLSKGVTQANLGNLNGKTPATRVADKFRSLSANKRPNTVATIRTNDGKYIIGRNSGGVINGDVQKALDIVGINEFEGQCAEVNTLILL